MGSKMTISAILYRLFEETRKWECNKGIPKEIPADIRGRPITNHYVWRTSPVLKISFDEYDYLVRLYLKITNQKRIVRERWRDMIVCGYITEIGESGAYKLELNLIRPLFGEPNPEEDDDMLMAATDPSIEEVRT